MNIKDFLTPNEEILFQAQQHRLALVATVVTLIMIISPIHVFGLEEENKLLFPKSIFPQSDSYKSGFTDGFLGQSFKGHHTQDYIYGFLNGTSTYVYNYNETSGHTMDWYIGLHNGAAIIDDQYQRGDLGPYPGCHVNKDYCDGFKKGWQEDANALG